MTNNFDSKYDLKEILDSMAWSYNDDATVIWPSDAPEDLGGFDVWVDHEHNTLVIEEHDCEFEIGPWLMNHLDELWEDVMGYPNQ